MMRIRKLRLVLTWDHGTDDGDVDDFSSKVKNSAFFCLGMFYFQVEIKLESSWNLNSN